jgi:hypothetical protein
MQHSKILILDFGSQVTQLIARRVREAHVFCEVHPCDVTSDWVRDYAKDGNLKGIILSGSHASVYEVDDRAPRCGVRAGYSRSGNLLWHADHGRTIGRQSRSRAPHASLVMPKFAHMVTQHCSKALKTLPHLKVKACSRSG